MKKIKLSQGKYALVDDEDFEYLNQFKWNAHHRRRGLYYATRLSTGNKKRYHIDMHRVILNAKINERIDHANNNTLDNRRKNLRKCNTQENARNKRIGSNNQSGFKGVGLKYNKWRARIMINGKTIYLGNFNSKIEAALAYNKAAIKYFGEFAVLNRI